MIDATMSETLSSYYLENESDSNRSFWCESDIIISSSQLRDLDSCTQHSFVSFGAESFYPEGSGYIAGISGLQSDSFDNAGNTENSYMFFYHTKDALSDKVIDAEKTISSSADTTLCWAATASNLLTRTGWLTSMTKTEDHLLNTYRSSFITGSTNGGNPYDGIVWYLTGNYPLNGIDGWDQLKPDFNSSLIYSPPVLNYSNYLSSQNASRYSYDYLINAVNELRDGNAVGLVLEQYVIDSSSNSRRKNGHVITLQGFTYQATDNPNDIKVTGIIIADSDDNMNFDGGNNSIGSSYAPNRLDIIPISYMFGNVYLHPWYWPTENYTPWRIVQTTTLKPAHFTTLSSCGVQVSRGATLLRETVQNGYTMNVSSSGLAMETTVLLGGRQTVSFGGVTLSTMISSGGAQDILWGGMASNTKVFSGGVQIISSGGSALDTTVFSDGSIKVSSGGKAEQAVLNGGIMNVYSSGYAEQTVLSGGIQKVLSNGEVFKTVVSTGGSMSVSSGGRAYQIVLDGGTVHVLGEGTMSIDNQFAPVGSITLGGVMYKDNVLTDCSDVAISYKLDRNTPVNTPLITNLSSMEGVSRLTLKITWREKYGTYVLAQYANGFINNGTLDVYDLHSNSINCSLSGWTNYSFPPAGNTTYTLRNDGADITLEISGVNVGRTTRGDIDYNGKSDTLYVRRNRSETEGMEIQYGMDGTSELQDGGILDSEVRIIGGYDMDWNHKVDLVTCRSIEIDSTDCLVIEYAQSGDLNDVHEIDRINNSANVDWNIYCGNLAGHDWKNSILWHAPSLGSLGYWADAGGNDSWVSIGNVYDSSWEVLGLGDFSNDSVHRDAVLFKYGINTIVEITASGGFRSLGILGDGWEVATIGDFSNDGVDDLILYNAGSGLVGKWADGVSTGWSSLGTVETGVAIEGAGDYNGDGSMDLLARKSDGTMGYYASANVSQFTSFGYAMDSSWTVIA